MMKTLHSYWAYIVLVLLIVAVVNAINGVMAKREFKAKDLRISLFTLIVAHIQLVLGLGWYFMSPWYKSLKSNGMDNMDTTSRLLALEHPIMMLIGIVFITIGWSKHKRKTTDQAKFKTIAIFYGLGLLFILSKIPWNLWFSN